MSGSSWATSKVMFCENWWKTRASSGMPSSKSATGMPSKIRVPATVNSVRIVSGSSSTVSSTVQSSVVKKGTCDVPPVHTTALESRRLENPVITFRLPVVWPSMTRAQSTSLLNSAWNPTTSLTEKSGFESVTRSESRISNSPSRTTMDGPSNSSVEQAYRPRAMPKAIREILMVFIGGRKRRRATSGN